METIVYLKDVKFEKQSIGERTPAGLKYNCKTCKKVLYTKPYGSYDYCINCFNNYYKKDKPKPKPKYNIDEVDFID